MCGRFTLNKSPDEVTRHFGLAPGAVTGLRPRYNIAPTQAVGVVRRAAGGGRELAGLRWGLVPSWSRATPPGTGLINARAETVASKPAFRAAYRERRCLIPADGFYEWQATNGRKQPWHIHLKGGPLFAFGGLWEQGALESCAIITTAANDLLAPLHDRMPLILRPHDYDAWLAEGERDPRGLLRPYPAEEMDCYKVSPLVGRAAVDGPECLARLQEGDTG